MRGRFFRSFQYNIVLKLKGYIKICDYDFKEIIEKLKTVTSVKVQLTGKISSIYIPKVDETLAKLFDTIGFLLPRKVNY